MYVCVCVCVDLLKLSLGGIVLLDRAFASSHLHFQGGRHTHRRVRRMGKKVSDILKSTITAQSLHTNHSFRQLKTCSIHPFVTIAAHQPSFSPTQSMFDSSICDSLTLQLWRKGIVIRPHGLEDFNKPCGAQHCKTAIIKKNNRRARSEFYCFLVGL